jgi:hypothetical protein
VPLSLLVQLVQNMHRSGLRSGGAQPSPWRPVGASDADESLLDGMAAVPLSLTQTGSSLRADPAAVVRAPLGWRELAIACQLPSPPLLLLNPGQPCGRQAMDAAGTAAFRATAAAAAVMRAGNGIPDPGWRAIEPMAAAARRLMSEAGATALLLQLAPWEPGETAWGNALAFFAAAHAYPAALIAALPAMTDAAACLAAHTDPRMPARTLRARGRRGSGHAGRPAVLAFHRVQWRCAVCQCLVMLGS